VFSNDIKEAAMKEWMIRFTYLIIGVALGYWWAIKAYRIQIG